jgi:chromosome segregation ATPase
MNDGLLISHSRSIDATPRDRVTTMANAMQRRPIVIVMGVPGSGASLCAHVLSALGVEMAGLESGSRAGPWERAEIVALHDRILALFNRAHLGPYHDFALPVAWWADPRVVGIKREIVTCLEAGMGAGYFGFKDPRAARLLPVWQQVANELKLAPRLVLCLRNPAQIAALSSARDGLDPAIEEYRWLANTVDFFRNANCFDICTVEYENWFEDPAANVTRLRDFLGLEWQQGESDLSLLVSGIVDAAAQAEEAGRRKPSQPLVRALYKLARRVGGDGGARDEITNIAFQFVGFQQLQRPFQLAFEEVAKTAAKFRVIELELDDLRNAALERDALVETQRAQIEVLAGERDIRIAIEGEASSLKARLAERETALAEVSREVVDLTASLQSARAEDAAQQEALQRAEQAAQQQAVTAEAMQGEIATLQEALACAEQVATAAEVAQAEVVALRETVASSAQQIQEQAAAAETKMAEAATLRESLARAEHATQERDAAADAMRSEIAVLREALERGEQEAQQRDAAAASMQIELATLRGGLAQAERAAQERGAAADATRGEIAVLREALERTAQEAQQRDTAAKAVTAELAMVRGALAQAESAAQERRAAAETAQTEAATLREALVRSELLSSDRAMSSAAIRAEVAALRHRLAVGERELEERAVAVKALQRELSALRQALKQAEDKAQQSADATRAIHSDIVRLRDALAEGREQAREQAAAVETFEAEVMVLRRRLAHTEQERAAAVAQMQAETEVLHGRLARAEGEAVERTAAAAATRSESEALRGRLAQAERAEQEQAAAVATLQVEIDLLRDALEAARHVGKAAMAALQISAEALPQPDPQPRRWRQVLGQIFGGVKRHRSGRVDMALQSERG